MFLGEDSEVKENSIIIYKNDYQPTKKISNSHF